MSASVLAEEVLFLGDDLIPWLMLAIGAALAVANLAAHFKPPLIDPKNPKSKRREPAPLSRVIPFTVVGVALSIWAIATLAS